jgi:integrase
MRRSKGEGSIHKRKDGRWHGRYIANGKRKYVYGNTRKEVAQKLTAAISEVNNGLFCEDKGITVKQHIGNWLTTSKSSVRPKTWERYEQICRIHIVPEIGHLKLKSVTPMMVQDLYRRKLEILSPRTVVYVHVTLHKSLSQALKWNLIPKNVTELVDRPRIIKEEIKPLGADEVERLFETVADHPLEALYILAVTTGLRKGEILGLRWTDVDLDSKTLQVRRSLSFMKGGSVFVPPKTAKGKRNIGLSRISIEALQKHRLLQAEQKELWSEDHDLVFPNTMGQPRQSNSVVNTSFERIKRKGNLPNIRFHDLRHTCATLLLSKGVHPKIVQELLGHSSISITLDTYSHVLPNMQEKVVEAMEEIFG